MIKVISNSEDETIEFANKIAKQIKKDTVIVLSGDLGSGKTKFTEGVLKNFGLEDEISSPTFTLVNEYNTKDFDIFHFDVYRISDIDEFFAIGGEEYFERGACIIEWGEIIESVLPKNYIKMTFSRDTENETRREINIEFFGNANLEI